MRAGTNYIGGIGKVLVTIAFSFLVIVAGVFVLIPKTAYACAPGEREWSDRGGIVHCESVSGNQVTNTTQTPSGAAQTQTATVPPDPFAFLTNGLLVTVLSPIAIIAWLIFKIGTLLLGLASIVFNWSMIIVVFEFAKYFGNSPGMLTAWKVLRDFGNIALIFGFIFMGISTILDLHSYPWKKALPSLVIAAVLLNFSLFMAEAVVDAANVVSLQLYKQSFTQTACQTGAGEGNSIGNLGNFAQCALEHGVASEISQKLQIASVYNTDSTTEGDFFQLLNGAGNYFSDPLPFVLKFVGLAIVVTLAAVVFFAASFMILSRGVVLAFLMVTSPIGIAGHAIPQFQKMAKDWSKKLIDQALFAPAFLIMLLAALKMTDGLNQLVTTNGGLASALSSISVVNTGPIIIFVLIIGFLIGALLMAKQFGIYGGDFAINAASALVYGATARGTNFILGGSAANLRRFQQRTGFGGKAGEFAVNRLVRPIEMANLDARRFGVGAILGAAGATYGAKPAEHATIGEMAHLYGSIVRGQESKDLEAKYNKEKKLAALEEAAHHGSLDDSHKQTLKGLSLEALEGLHGVEEGSEAIAQNLTSEQFESLMGSKKLSDAQKGKLGAARYGLVARQLAANDRAAIRKWSSKDLERYVSSDAFKNLSVADRNKFTGMLSDSQFEGLSDSQKLVDSSKKALQSGRYSALTDQIARGDDVGMRDWSDKDLERFVQSDYFTRSAADGGISDTDKERFAELLSSDQYDRLSQSERLSDQAHAVLAQGRYRSLENQIATVNRSAIRKWQGKDLERYIASSRYRGLGPNEQEELVSLLSDEQYDRLKGSGRLANSQIQDLETRRQARFDSTMVSDGAGGRMTRLERTLRDINTPSKRAKIDDSVLARRDVYGRLDPADFDAIRRADKLNATQRAEIGLYIKDQMLNSTDPAKSAEFMSYWQGLPHNKKQEFITFYKIPV